MEKWRRVWRVGLVQLFTRSGLSALHAALCTDDRRLIQGAVTTPPPLEVCSTCHVTGACAISYCAWHGEELRTVGQVEAAFHRICDQADANFGEPAACRFFLNWFDETSRAEMRRQLLLETELALRDRVAPAA